jgi:hypothetical protein
MIEKVVNVLSSKGRFRTKRELIENAFWFSFSSYIGLIQPKVVYKNKKLDINYFGISIAPSGVGKSFIYEEAKKLLEIENKKYIDVIRFGLPKEVANDEITIDNDKVKIESFVPNFENTIEGTKEGLYLRALALSKSLYGSLNLIHEEIMDVIKESNINVMKELYDGKFIGKIIKSSINENLYGLTSNMLVFGSSTSLKRDPSIYTYFIKAVGSGIYRRSFIYYQEPTDIEVNNNKSNEKIDFEYLREYIRKWLKGINEYGLYPEIKISNEANEYIELINYELIDFANQYKEDERFSAEAGSLDKLIKLSGLSAILNDREEIKYEDIFYAYDMYKRFRESNKELFNVEPQHKRIYKVIKKLKKATKTEILESDIFNRSSFNEDLLLVEELAYRNNERLIVKGSRIKTYSIEPMQESNLNKVIVSYPKVDKREKTTEYISVEIPFFGSSQSLESLVVSDKVSNFCLVHFKDGKRKSINTIENQNCIGIDVDYGISLNEVLDLLRDYTYIIYTTKSHQKEKDGLVNDRFRILLPTKTYFNVDNERHKELISNVCEALGVGSYDVSTRNQDRLWFTNPNGEIYKNQGELFDVIPYLPDTNKRESIERQLVKFNEGDYNEDEVSKRIGGMVKWFLNSTYKGNRNINLFRLGSFILDLTNDLERSVEEVYKANSMLEEPISEKELRDTIIKSLKRRVK